MVKIKIANAKCMSCFHNIEDALKDFDQKIVMKTDVNHKAIEVESVHSIEQLTKLIQDGGYLVEEVIS